MRALLPKSVIAITLGRRIWIARPMHGEALERVLRHERVHVRQMAETGLLRFLFRYVAEYLGNRFRGLGHDAAYRAISFEREAFAAERVE